MAENNNIPQFVNSDSFMADKNYVKWLSDLKKRFRMAQLKAAVKVNTEMLKFYWSLGEDICEKQKQYKWGANFMKRLSLDLRAEFPKAEGFSVVNLYYIKRWFVFYSSHTNFFYQAGKKLQDVENSTTPMPNILLRVPWRHHGYSYHNEKTIQHHRDIMKDHILSKYGLHLLRLSTKGSGEREKIVTALNKIDNIQSSKRC